VRNEAIFRLARIYFQKDQPVNALHAVERISGAVPQRSRRSGFPARANPHGQRPLCRGRAHPQDLQDAEKPGRVFSTYNLGIALLKDGKEQEGRQYLDRTGQIGSNPAPTLAIKDKSNLVLGTSCWKKKFSRAPRHVLDRVRLTGPFSNRALLGSGWADAFQGASKGRWCPGASW
jgi:hypothetical protein